MRQLLRSKVRGRWLTLGMVFVLATIGACETDAFAPFGGDADRWPEGRMEISTLMVNPDGSVTGTRLVGSGEEAEVIPLTEGEQARLLPYLTSTGVTGAAGPEHLSPLAENGAGKKKEILAGANFPLGFHTFDFEDAEGVPVRVISLTPKAPGLRRKAGTGLLTLIYRNHKLSTSMASVTKNGRPGTVTTRFGDDGRPNWVTEVFEGTASTKRSAMGDIGAALQRSCDVLLGVIGPQPLHAQLVSCETEAFNVHLADLAVHTAVIAAGGCLLVAGPLSGACISLIGALGYAQAQAVSARQSLSSCLEAQDPGGSVPLPPGGTDVYEYRMWKTGGLNCATYIIEESIDGGPWQYVGTVEVCSLEQA